MGYKSIGKRLQMAREAAGLNQEQLAARIGCSQSTLSNYEKGKRRIYLAQLDKIARELNKPVEFFLQPLESFNGTGVMAHYGAEGPNFPPRGSTPPHAGTDEEQMLALFRSLTPAGRKLAVEFINWIRANEVNGNG